MSIVKSRVNTCQNCGKSFNPGGGNPGKYCSPQCLYDARSAAADRDFFANLERSGGCWLWTGKIDRWGYGLVKRRGRYVRAHRHAYALARGVELAPDAIILHSCDVRHCCNPAHLRPGTRAENTRDMLERGRGRWQRR